MSLKCHRPLTKAKRASPSCKVSHLPFAIPSNCDYVLPKKTPDHRFTRRSSDLKSSRFGIYSLTLLIKVVHLSFSETHHPNFKWVLLHYPRSVEQISSYSAELSVKKKDCQPFDRLELSVKKKRDCQPFDRLELSIPKIRKPFQAGSNLPS